MARKKKPQRRNSPQKKLPTPVVIVEKQKNFFERFWALIVGAGVIVTLILGYQPIKDLFKTPHEKYEDDTFLQGDLNTPKINAGIESKKKNAIIITPYVIADTPPNFQSKPISATNPKVNGVLIGNFIKKQTVNILVNDLLFQCALDDLKKGIKLFSTSLSGCTDTNLTIGVKDERLYVSTVFKDIEKEETVGFIEYNHWKLFKPNLLEFRNDDQKLEVKDKQNRIVFSVKFSGWDNTVFISGYFLSQNSVLILSSPYEKLISDSIELEDIKKDFPYSKAKLNSDTIHGLYVRSTICIPKTNNNWKTDAIKFIEQLKSVFD